MNSLQPLKGFAGKVIREGAEIIIIFKVNDKYYPATDANADIMDTFLHTGDKVLLDQLEDEVEF